MKIKFNSNSAFKDKRGLYWTSWKNKKNSKINFNHDKFSLSKKMLLEVYMGTLNLGNW